MMGAVDVLRTGQSEVNRAARTSGDTELGVLRVVCKTSYLQTNNFQKTFDFQSFTSKTQKRTRFVKKTILKSMIIKRKTALCH